MRSRPRDPLLEVLGPGPRLEGRLEVAVVAETLEPLLDLRPQRVVDGDPVDLRRLPEEEEMHVVEAGELGHGLDVVVHPQVDEHVTQPGVPAVSLHHEERRRLLAAPVAARGLCGGEALEQARGQRAALGGGERLREGRDRLRADQDVPLCGEGRARRSARPVHAPLSGEARAAAAAVDHADLPLAAVVVGRGEPLDDLLRAQPLPQERQPVRAVAGVRVGLRRDGADARLGPRHHRADGQELRLGGDTPLARVEVAGGDRVRRDDRLSHTSSPSGRARGGPGR